MIYPDQFPSVLSKAIAIISALYVSISVAGYATFGQSTQSPILDNLPAGPIAVVAIIMITAHVLLACPILLTTFSLEVKKKSYYFIILYY